MTVSLHIFGDSFYEMETGTHSIRITFHGREIFIFEPNTHSHIHPPDSFFNFVIIVFVRCYRISELHASITRGSIFSPSFLFGIGAFVCVNLWMSASLAPCFHYLALLCSMKRMKERTQLNAISVACSTLYPVVEFQFQSFSVSFSLVSVDHVATVRHDALVARS